MTPYTTKTGLKIGSAYEKRQRHDMDSEDLLIQEALLNKDTYRREILTDERMTVLMISMIVVVVGLIAFGVL
jgi:hypothetical protein